jgi:hypothetical protein
MAGFEVATSGRFTSGRRGARAQSAWTKRRYVKDESIRAYLAPPSRKRERFVRKSSFSTH